MTATTKPPRRDWRKLEKGRWHVIKLDVVTSDGTRMYIEHSYTLKPETQKLAEDLFSRLLRDE